jgi:hypothetical protein
MFEKLKEKLKSIPEHPIFKEENRDMLVLATIVVSTSIVSAYLLYKLEGAVDEYLTQQFPEDESEIFYPDLEA